jgi:hypothetical protein
MDKQITLHILSDAFSVCQIKQLSEIPFDEEFIFLGKTDEEISLVCRTEAVPARALIREDGWRGVKIQGVLDFGLVGILSGITAILAQNQISIFAVSTYNTDYILVKDVSLALAQTALEEDGYEFG